MISYETIKKYSINNRPEVNNSRQVYEELKDLFTESKELLIVFHINTRNKIICREIVHIGGLNSCIIDPKCIFRNAITLNANSIIIAHNHPSSDLEPSQEDKDMNRRIRQCGEILQLRVIDHIIFNHEDYKSIGGVNNDF